MFYSNINIVPHMHFQFIPFLILSQNSLYFIAVDAVQGITQSLDAIINSSVIWQHLHKMCATIINGSKQKTDIKWKTNGTKILCYGTRDSGLFLHKWLHIALGLPVNKTKRFVSTGT